MIKNDTMEIKERMTLDVLLKLKKEKLQEIKDSQKRMAEIADNIFTPNKPMNSKDYFFKSVSTGIAIFDGVKIGINLINRIKNIINKNKE